MQDNSQQAAVLDSEQAWLLPLPKNGFTPPKFCFGQMVMSLQEQARGRIVGIEFVSPEHEASKYVTCGWYYTVTLTVLPVYLRSFAVNQKWQPLTEIFPESDLVAI